MKHVADAVVVHMASLPLDANVLFMTVILPTCRLRRARLSVMLQCISSRGGFVELVGRVDVAFPAALAGAADGIVGELLRLAARKRPALPQRQRARAERPQRAG